MYQRFLTNRDYLGLITEEGLSMLTRGDEERLAQAEQRAEMKIVDYLDQFYELGEELAKGKNIKEYNHLITYPGGVFIRKDGRIWRTTTSISACHKPTSTVYWEPAEDYTLPAEVLADIENKIKPYYQLKTYAPGDIVSYLGATWKCVEKNGWDFMNIQIPGIKYWGEIEVQQWIPNNPYDDYAVVEFEKQFYMVMPAKEGDEERDWSVLPDEAEFYGLIGDYDEKYNYTIDSHDYVVQGGKVYEPLISPNAEEPKENVNIVVADPRNYNLVNYMTAIALYYLNALISPTNMPQTRIDMFNEAMEWIVCASKMKIDPHIKRRLENDLQTPKDDWAMASFETNTSSQLNSPWFV